MASTPPPPPEEEGEPIIVTGDRPRDYDPGTGGDPGTGTSEVPPGFGGDGSGSSATQQSCRNQRALEAKEDINGQGDVGTHEHGTLTYTDAAGNVQKSGIIQGDTLGIPQSAIQAEMDRLGITRAQVIGFVHNHPAWQYSDFPDIQRYPSGGGSRLNPVPGGDWNAARWFVSGGAGGTNGANFSLYVIDTAGNIREFRYSEIDKYEPLTAEERERGVNLPVEVDPGAAQC